MTTSRGSAASMVPAASLRPTSWRRHSLTVRLRMACFPRFDASTVTVRNYSLTGLACTGKLSLHRIVELMPWKREGPPDEEDGPDYDTESEAKIP